MHRVYTELPIPAPGERLALDGEEAVHALRVKRLAAGDRVEVLGGRGVVADGVVMDGGDSGGGGGRRAGPVLVIGIEAVRNVAPVSPRVEVCSATPKGPRAGDLVDQLSQVGAAAWRPLRCTRSIVDPGEQKLDRLERVAREASKQAGRAWTLRIEPGLVFRDAVRAADGGVVVLAESSGGVWSRASARSGTVRVLVGPEGGFTPAEIADARGAGVSVVRFGPHTMRIETAAVAAAAVILAGAGCSEVEGLC